MTKSKHALLAVLTAFSLTALAQGPSSHIVLTAPPDITVSCQANLDDPRVTGLPTGNIPIDRISHEDVWLEKDECGNGILLRRFFATDGAGEEVMAEQTIHLLEWRPPFVKFPKDLCMGQVKGLDELRPENLPPTCGLPLVEEGCREPVISFTDKSSTLPNGQVRIYRTWKVTDPCRGLANATHIQVLEATAEVGTAAGIPVEVGSTDRFKLFQNRPNPFTTGTVIPFYLPENCTAKLKIQDGTGRVLHLAEGDFQAGQNEFHIEGSQLPALGILWYTLETPTDRATKRMVVIW